MEKFFDYIGIADDKQVCLMAFKLKRGASAWWDCVQLNCTHERKLLTIMEENEKINDKSVLTTRLPIGVVQIVPGL